MSKRKLKLPAFPLVCTKCGATANGNTREADNWTLAPRDMVACPDCNGSRNTPVIAIRSKTRGKVFFMPVREPNNGQ
jgi:hypothetical protein